MSDERRGPPKRGWRKRARPSTRRPTGRATGRPTGRPLVVVFAKAPEPGRVKTRLTPVLRAGEAADLARALLLDTLDIVDSIGADVVVAFAPATGRRSFERLLGRRRRLIAQGPGDLGSRLAGVTGQLLAVGKGPVIAVGSDCPALTAEVLRRAAAGLARADVVLGPALDGGYYLVALKAPHPEIFQGIPWGTAQVMAATRERIEAARLAAAILEPARDLDTPEDLFEWYAGGQAENLRERFPRTWRILHAALPPRRFSALEAVVRGERLA
ncbi:MAG TPA: TIGR04282 family arsenosugar biosynthesis glycosyltransferase [Gemmatimonadota bacterium]|nr:TIGR04282 family arsenosugar biosynthesis glycosyltransferase [Gemmatimonadota bacterium]